MNEPKVIVACFCSLLLHKCVTHLNDKDVGSLLLSNGKRRKNKTKKKFQRKKKRSKKTRKNGLNLLWSFNAPQFLILDLDIALSSSVADSKKNGDQSYNINFVLKRQSKIGLHFLPVGFFSWGHNKIYRNLNWRTASYFETTFLPKFVS